MPGRQYARAVAAHRRLQPPASNKADRTLLRCRLPSGAASVAVEDVLAAGQVYVRDLGLLVSRADAPTSLAAHRQKIAGEQTILSRVREMPDQSFDQAMHALWRPAQNHGPTMLSLACDNAKFIVEREGAVRFGQLVLRPRFPLVAVELARLDFGIVGIDTTVRPSQATTPLPLSIADTTFQKGLGLHANADLNVLLEGRSSHLKLKWACCRAISPEVRLSFRSMSMANDGTIVEWCDRARHRGTFV